MLRVKDIIKFLEEKFPPRIALHWDNIGLHIGDANQEVHTIMVALEASTDVIQDAVCEGVDLIVAHHPFIYSPLKSIDFRTPKGKNIKDLIKNDIALYVLHSNYDIANGGMGDVLAEKIGLVDIKPFSMIDEIHGEGRIGKLEKPMSLDELSTILCGKFAPHIGLVSKVECENIENIETVAVIGGSGGKYIYDAKDAGADVLVTGDIKYHDAMDAKDIGLSILDIGHFAEIVMQDAVSDLIKAEFEMLDIRKSSARNPISRQGREVK